MLLWMATCIANDTASEERLAIFRRLLLTMPMRFKVIASEEERLFAHVNLRELITGAHACMGRSALQRVYEVCQWRERRAKTHGGQNATPPKLAQLWNDQVKMARTSEPVTETFMGMAFRLWEQLLCHPTCRDPILWAERTWGKNNPFDTVMKMEAVAIKAKSSVESAEWLINSMIFYVKRGFMTSGEFSVRTLTGKGAGNRGLLDMFLLKKHVLIHISTTLLDTMEFEPGTKARAPGAFSSCSFSICHTLYNVFVIRIIYDRGHKASEDIHLTATFDVNANEQDGDGGFFTGHQSFHASVFQQPCESRPCYAKEPRPCSARSRATASSRRSSEQAGRLSQLAAAATRAWSGWVDSQRRRRLSSGSCRAASTASDTTDTSSRP
jgi:hypothetical protein